MEYSRKFPRSRRETSGWDRPSSLAASTCVRSRWRMISSMRATSSAFKRCASASGHPRSLNMLPLPRSIFVSSTFTHLPCIDIPGVLLCCLQPAPDQVMDLRLRCFDAPLGLLLKGTQNVHSCLEQDGVCDSAGIPSYLKTTSTTP